MNDKSLFKALFPGAILGFMLATGTVAVFLPLIFVRLVYLIVTDKTIPTTKN